MNPLRPSHETARWNTIAVALLALSLTVIACGKGTPAAEHVEVGSQSFALVGNGKLEAGEQCDDGNPVSGDGCSAAGVIEAGFLCHVPGRSCSLASLCGNGVVNTGEACDDGNTIADSNGCSADCGLSLCGNGVVDNRQWPNFDQETCDDGNQVEGDGCSRLCEVEPGFSCAGSPSRCVSSGAMLFNTGVDTQNRRLESGADPHWFYSGTTTGAATSVRTANDWPQELQTARFMAAPLGAPVCVYQDFLLPSTLDVARFRVRLAMFNDNDFDSAQVNGTPFLPVVVSQPGGQPWQKNIVREFGPNAPWRSGLNRITICNENEESLPNAYRYLVVDAYDDRCGDGILSPREDCDDGNVANNDGCSATCGIEPGYACTGAPSVCAATCGNGVLNASEECDDGNKTSGDGCSASCRVEAGRACPVPGAACVATCGNGVIDPGELCDDGNQRVGDGCSASCRIERGYECSGAPSSCTRTCGNGRLDPGELCDDGNTTFGDGCSNVCTLELGYACPTAGQACVMTCGNGTVNPGEQCDDGNLVAGDGCSSDCRLERGYACSTPASGLSSCVATCGNGVLDANETCDDGNKVSGDGCSFGCRVEVGYSCSGAPSACSTACGDGIVAGNESCDDGNHASGDGCSGVCQVEAGWRCPTPGTSCVNTCGNGTIEAGEACDDGNKVTGDGCDGFCRVEAGYGCSGKPSACVARCGDGIRAGGEACDDGNLKAGDGCDAACNVEPGYTCLGNPSVCAVACGDGVKAASEECDDGNLTVGDGCDASCHVEAEYGCRNTGVRAVYTRLGRTDCTQVSSMTEPTLASSAVQAALGAPGRYRVRYVAGAVSYSGGGSWYPGVVGVNYSSAAGVQRFSLGFVGGGAATRAVAEAAGAGQQRDFDAVTGDVRLALIDTDCALNDNSNTPVTYRVDALSICQRVPVLTSPPPPARRTSGNVGGVATPGATVRVYLDGAAAPACTVTVGNDGSWSCNLAGASEGSHAVVVSSTVLSATETAASVTIDIDPTAPAAPVIVIPASGALLTASPAVIAGTAEHESLVTVREGATELCTATTNAAGEWGCLPTTPLAEGAHSITATAVDDAGNVSPASTPSTFTIDTIPPVAPAFTAPASGAFLATGTPMLEGTAEAGSQVIVREGSVTVCTASTNAGSQWTCAPSSALAEGAHSVTATARDAAGHESAASSPLTFTVDTIAPDTSFTKQPSARTKERNASFAYASTEANVSFECSLDNAAFAPCSDTYAVALGEHVLRARAVDRAGNVDPSPAEARWTVEETQVTPPPGSPEEPKPTPSSPEEPGPTPPAAATGGGGCSASPNAATQGPAWLFVLGLLCLRRPSRRRAA